MNTRIIIAAAIASFGSQLAFGQMGGYGGGSSQSQPPPSSSGQSKQTTTTTKTVMPVGVKAYLDSQMASSKDKKFHVALNGKDLALTPIKIHDEKTTKLGGGKSSTAVDMKGADGKVYEIDFVSSGGQVTGASVGKVNGKAPSS